MESNRKNKRYVVINDSSNEKIHFGDKRYDNYTIHKDDARKYKYLKRHYKNEDWNNPSTAGFWSANLLWNLPTIDESAADIEERHGLNIINII